MGSPAKVTGFVGTGKKPTPLETKTFDIALILHADHEFNASTFAARVTAATLSDVHSAVVAGISALKGRHGLRRCRYRGETGMQRWVGLGIIANNLLVLGRAVL